MTTVFSQLQRRFASAPGAAVAPAAPPLRRGLAARAGEAWHRAVDAVVPMETVIVHAPHAAGRVEALAPSHDLVWSTSYPYHAHLLALRAARRHRKPFVADLRDPWSLNWVHRRKLAPTRWVERAAERAVLEGADAVVVTTETLATRYREMFPARASRIHAVHNCFEPMDLGARIPQPPNAPLRVMHFGNVYGPWSLRTLFDALAGLRREGALPHGVEVHNLGKLSDRDRDHARALGLDGVVRALPTMDYADGLRALRDADLLVLAAWDDPDAALYIQGKLYDYLLAGTHFVAETANPEVCDIVTRTGAGAVVAPGDVAAMRAALVRAAGGASISLRPRDPHAISYYSAPEATARLAAIFDEVCR
ncbi:MAG: glycosyltransferase [Polyangiales bacterium]